MSCREKRRYMILSKIRYQHIWLVLPVFVMAWRTVIFPMINTSRESEMYQRFRIGNLPNIIMNKHKSYFTWDSAVLVIFPSLYTEKFLDLTMKTYFTNHNFSKNLFSVQSKVFIAAVCIKNVKDMILTILYSFLNHHVILLF